MDATQATDPRSVEHLSVYCVHTGFVQTDCDLGVGVGWRQLPDTFYHSRIGAYAAAPWRGHDPFFHLVGDPAQLYQNVRILASQGHVGDQVRHTSREPVKPGPPAPT